MNTRDDRPLLMSIEEVFGIKSRGAVVAGRIQQGNVRKGDAIEVGYPGKPILKATIAGVEQVDSTPPGDQIRVLLRKVEVEQVQPGMLLAAPGVLASLRENEE